MRRRMTGRGIEAGMLIAALVVAPLMATAAERVFEGRLSKDDMVVPTDGSYYQVHEIVAEAGQELVIDLMSSDFDAYLIVHAPSGEVFTDDDGGEGFNSRLSITAEESGTWKVFANTIGRGEVGQYRLVVRTMDAGAFESKNFNGTLNSASRKLPANGSRYNEHVLTLEAGQEIMIGLASNDFDTVLFVHSPSGQSYEDDDGGQGTNSRLSLTTDVAGEWRIVATAFDSEEMGDYTLTVRTLKAE